LLVDMAIIQVAVLYPFPSMTVASDQTTKCNDQPFKKPVFAAVSSVVVSRHWPEASSPSKALNSAAPSGLKVPATGALVALLAAAPRSIPAAIVQPDQQPLVVVADIGESWIRTAAGQHNRLKPGLQQDALNTKGTEATKAGDAIFVFFVFFCWAESVLISEDKRSFSLCLRVSAALPLNRTHSRHRDGLLSLQREGYESSCLQGRLRGQLWAW
jgi:hypothetical protein